MFGEYLHSMRRDMTSSLRACLAAESWKRLYPDGAPGKGKRTDLQPNPKIGVTFPDFAMASFKVSKTYAEQALAILNFSPELIRQRWRLVHAWCPQAEPLCQISDNLPHRHQHQPPSRIPCGCRLRFVLAILPKQILTF
jgi:hypothetical protein